MSQNQAIGYAIVTELFSVSRPFRWMVEKVGYLGQGGVFVALDTRESAEKRRPRKGYFSFGYCMVTSSLFSIVTLSIRFDF